MFISYSHADVKWLARIRTMLTPLIRADRITVWDDARIKAGAKWRPEIDRGPLPPLAARGTSRRR